MADSLGTALSELVRKAELDGDADFLQEGVRVLSQALMESVWRAGRIPQAHNCGGRSGS